LVGGMLVVCAAHQTNSSSIVHVRLRESVDVVELQASRLAASPAILGDERASAFVPHVHRPLDPGRNVRGRRKNRLHGPVSRLPAHPEALLQQIRDERVQRPLEDDGEISIANPVLEEALRLPQLVTDLTRARELESERLG
jgi:hypothetical protein